MLRKNNKQIMNINKKEILEKLINKTKNEDYYILDDTNAIIVIHNDGEGYYMIHKRLIDHKLIEINKWYQKVYYFGYRDYETAIQELNLFKVQNLSGSFGSLYDYKNDKFIIEPNTWDYLFFRNDNKILNQYNGVLGSFKISSDYEEDDLITYYNPLTEDKVCQCFSIHDGDYYALINLDGTIRGNKLFKGENLNTITEIIDLNEYKSLEDFKEQRKKICNDQKRKKKEEYQELIKKRSQNKNDLCLSPYLDNEVLETLKLPPYKENILVKTNSPS